MAQRANIPKFGNWNNGNNVPYTQYFDNARKGRTKGKLINPNDPQENPEDFSVESSPSHGLQFVTGSGLEAAQIMHDRRSSREDDLRRPISHIPHYAATHKLSPGPLYRQYGDQVNSEEPQTQASRVSVGSDRSFELSPFHPNYRSKSTSISGVSSPSWEKKRSSSEGHGHDHNTLGRSRIKPSSRTNDNLKKVSTVPKFGEWDESNPASADGYTHIFNIIKEEKQIGSAEVHVATDHSSYPDGHKRANSEDSVTCCCFKI